MTITCPKCGATLQVADKDAGRSVRCPHCQEVFTPQAAGGAPSGAGPGAGPAGPSAAPSASRGGGWRQKLSDAASSPLELTPGKIAIAIGLVLVVLGRGCDAVSSRGVLRAKAKVQKIRADLSPREARDDTELEEAQEDVASASVNSAMHAYWFEWMFLIGSVVLVLGLLATAATGAWPERIVCFVMLAIFTFSIYIGGMAWLGSAANTIKSIAP